MSDGSTTHPFPHAPGASAPDPVRSGWEPRVLVVDDDPVCRVAAQALLEQLGLTVDAAGDGRQALTLAADRPYVAIFMDCLMPDVDGYQATREIRSRVGMSRGPLVIAVTEHSRHVSLAAGMDHHIAKPLRLERLRADCRALGLIRDSVSDVAAPVPDVPALEPRPGLTGYRTAELAEEFVGRAVQQMPEIWRAANLADTGALSRAAIELRQRALTVGATLISEVCAQIEHTVSGGHAEVAVALEPALRHALGATLDAAAQLRGHAAEADARQATTESAASASIRVAIADDDPFALLAIEKLIERGERLEFVGSATDVTEIVEVVANARPDVAVVDFYMPGGGGPEAARRIRELSPATRVIALTATDSPDAYLAMLHAGASGLVVKGSPAERLVQTIHRASERLTA